MAHCCCPQSGLDPTLPRGARSGVCQQSARLRPRSRWACRGSHGPKPPEGHASCSPVTPSPGGTTTFGLRWTWKAGGRRRRGQRTRSSLCVHRGWACLRSGARGADRARGCGCSALIPLRRCAPWPAVPPPRGNTSTYGRRNAGGWKSIVPSGKSGPSPRARCHAQHGW